MAHTRAVSAPGAIDQAGDGPPTGWHRVRTALVVVAGLLLIVVVMAAGSYLFRSQPGARSVGSAARALAATTTTVPDPQAFSLPPAGVYRASGSGFERIAVPSDTIHDSAVMPVSVSYLSGGCWRWRLDFNTAHWHEYDFCPEGGRLLLRSQMNSLTLDLGFVSISNLAQFTCDPPSPIVVESPRVGQVFPHRCTGTNSDVAGTSTVSGLVRIIGVRNLRVGSRVVQSIEMSRRQTIAGGQSGTLDETWWFATSTGMPLAEVRDYHLTTSSPIGSIAYVESGSWHLDSLAPAVGAP